MNLLARECPYDPPSHFMDMDRDWPKQSRSMGAVVTYTCPYKKVTWDESLMGN